MTDNKLARVTLKNNYAYVSVESGNRIAVIDISNPASPSIVNSENYAVLDLPYCLIFSDNYLFVTSVTNNTVAAFRLSELPTEPQPSSQTPVSDQQMQQAILIAVLGTLITSVLLVVVFKHHK